MCGSPPSIYWRVCLQYLTPLMTSVRFLYQRITFESKHCHRAYTYNTGLLCKLQVGAVPNRNRRVRPAVVRQLHVQRVGRGVLLAGGRGAHRSHAALASPSPAEARTRSRMPRCACIRFDALDLHFTQGLVIRHRHDSGYSTLPLLREQLLLETTRSEESWGPQRSCGMDRAEYVAQLAAARPGARFYRDAEHLVQLLRCRLGNASSRAMLPSISFSAASASALTCTENKFARSPFDQNASEHLKT